MFQPIKYLKQVKKLAKQARKLVPSVPIKCASKHVEALFLQLLLSIFSAFHSKESLVHPTRAIQFLVGVRGGSKDNAAAIGGPWSASLDGEDPATNPAVLVKTAIRTCKALTGIDLSGCTKWCRFLEINYRRQVRYKIVF